MDTKDLILNQLSSNVCYKLEDYFLDSEASEDEERKIHKITAFNKLNFKIKEPRLTNWDFLNQKNIEKLMNMKCQKEIKQFINSNTEGVFFWVKLQVHRVDFLKKHTFKFLGASLKKSPKGRQKDIFIQLMLSAQQFCKNHEFDVEQTGSMFSFFYLTHLYFTSDYDKTAEKVYIYFKDLLMCHSIPFPPSSKKIFSLKEAKDIIKFFGKIYLRNLPLIRYLCLPNFALYLNYEVPPEPTLPKKKDKANKPKKPKGGKGKKK